MKRIKAFLALMLALVLGITAFGGALAADIPPITAALWADFDLGRLQDMLRYTQSLPGEDAEGLLSALANVIRASRITFQMQGSNARLALGSEAGDVQSIFYTMEPGTGNVYLESDLFPGYSVKTNQVAEEQLDILEKYQMIGEKLSGADVEAWIQPYLQDVTAYWEENIAHSLTREKGQYIMPDGSVWPVKNTLQIVEGEFAGLIKLVFERLDSDQAFKDYMKDLIASLQEVSAAVGSSEEAPDLDAIFTQGRAIMEEAPLDSTKVLTSYSYYTDVSGQDSFTALELEDHQYLMYSLQNGVHQKTLKFIYFQTSPDAPQSAPANQGTSNARLGSQSGPQISQVLDTIQDPAGGDNEAIKPQPALEEFTALYQGVQQGTIPHTGLMEAVLDMSGKDETARMDMTLTHTEQGMPSEDLRLGYQTLSVSPLKAKVELSGSMITIPLPVSKIHLQIEEGEVQLPTLPGKNSTLLAITPQGEFEDEAAALNMINSFFKEGLPGLYERMETAFPKEAPLLNELLKNLVETPLGELMESVETAP